MMKQAEFDQQQNLLNQRNTQAEKMLGERYNDQLKLMVTRAALARQTAKNIYNDREADPLNMYTKTRLAAETYKKNMDSNITLYQSLQAQRQALYVDSKGNKLNPSNDSIRSIDYQIGLVHDQIDLDKQNSDNFTKQAIGIQKTYGLSEGSSSDAGSGTDSSTGTSHNNSSSDSAGEPDYTDPLSYLPEQ